MAAPVRGGAHPPGPIIWVSAPTWTASWLFRKWGGRPTWLEGGYDRALEGGAAGGFGQSPIRHTATGVLTKAPIVATGAMQAYLDWEYGLVEQPPARRNPWLLS